MNDSASPLKIVIYIFAGLVAITVAFKVLWILLGAVSFLFKLAVGIGVILVVGYIVYSLIKAAVNAVR
jgi:hypothetical protein